MAKKSNVIKAHSKPKFKVRQRIPVIFVEEIGLTSGSSVFAGYVLESWLERTIARSS